MSRSDRSIRQRLFSTDEHPTNVIEDRQTLLRYQNSRAVIALVGGLIGGCGLGFSFSMSGAVGVEPAFESITAFGVVGMVVAVLLVLYAVWPVVRWVAAAVLLLVPLLLLDLPLTWRFGLGVLGVGVSLVVASLLFLISQTARSLPRFARHAAALVAAAATVFAVYVPPAAAQVSSCGNTSITITSSNSGASQTWSGGSDEDVFDIRITDEPANFVVTADSEIRNGSMVVELIATKPLSVFQPDEPLLVWSEDIVSGASDRGSVGPSTVSFVRRDGIRFVDESRNIDLAISGGEGLYRITFTDAFTGASCTIDARVRVLSSPLDGPFGKSLTLGTFALLGATVGAIQVRPRRLSPVPDDDSGPADSPEEEIETEPPIAMSGAVRRITVALELDEKEQDLSELTLEDAGLGCVADFGAAIAVGRFLHIPVQVRTDPRDVDLGAALLTSSILLGDQVVGTLSMKDGHLELGDGLQLVNIDLRETSSDEEAGADPSPDQEQDMSGRAT